MAPFSSFPAHAQPLSRTNASARPIRDASRINPVASSGNPLVPRPDLAYLVDDHRHPQPPAVVRHVIRQ